MSLGHLSGVVRAYRRLAAVVATAVLLVSAVVAMLSPGSFASTSLVEVSPSDEGTDLRSAYYSGRVVAGQATPYVEMFQNGAVLAGVLRRLDPAASADEEAARRLAATTVVEVDRISVAIEVVSDRSASSTRVADAAASSFAELAQRRDPRGPDVVEVVARVQAPPAAPARTANTHTVVIMLIGSVSAVTLALVAALAAQRRSAVGHLSSKEERS